MRKLIFTFIIFFSIQLDAKFVSVPDKVPAGYCSRESFISQSQTSEYSLKNIAPIVSVHDLLKEKQDILYIKCHNSMQFKFEIFPIASSFNSSNSNPCIPETFIINIPKGRVYSSDGVILVNDFLIKELIWQWSPLNRNSFFNLSALPKLKSINGKVVVLTQEGHANYCHWMMEVLPKLAMLESKKIEYDWLYITTNAPFMRQTLALLGVDPKKILEVKADTYIEADQLIVPSAPSLSCYATPWMIDYLKTKFILAAEQYTCTKNFNKKIFISRKKSSNRKVINEDDVFKLFEEKGFTRYSLEDLPFLEQVILFKNANVIVSPHGAGLFNLFFSNPDIKVIELFQEHEDDTFWYLSQLLGFQHICVKTTEFKKDGGYSDTIIPLSIISHIIDSL